MTYEQKIILDTLCEVRDEMYEMVDKLKEKAQNEKDLDKSAVMLQAKTIETATLLIGRVAQKHGLKVGFVEME